MCQEKECSKIKLLQKVVLTFWIIVLIGGLIMLPGCATQCVEPVRQLDDITGYA